MTVYLEYTAQLKQAAETAREAIEVPPGSTLREACRRAGSLHGNDFRRLLLTEQGTLQTTLLVFHRDQPVSVDSDPELQEGDTITLMTPISGG